MPNDPDSSPSPAPVRAGQGLQVTPHLRLPANGLGDVFHTPPDGIAFAAAFPDASLEDRAGMQAAERALRDAGRLGEGLGTYTDTQGHPSLRDALARKLADAECTVTPEEIVVTGGSGHAISLVLQSMVTPGDVVLVERPAYFGLLEALKIAGAKAVDVPCDRDGIRPEMLPSLIDEHHPRLLCLVPDFSNPAGRVLSEERRLKVLEIARDKGVAIMEDAPFSDLYFDRKPPPSLQALSRQVEGSADWLIHIGSTSKSGIPARIGYVVAPQALRDTMVRLLQINGSATLSATQEICAEYLSHPAQMGAHLKSVRSRVQERSETMGRALSTWDGNRFEVPEGGYFHWLKLPGHMDAVGLARMAAEKGVTVMPGSMFYTERPKQRLRLSTASVPTELIHEGVSRLMRAMDHYECSYRGLVAAPASLSVTVAEPSTRAPEVSAEAASQSTHTPPHYKSILAREQRGTTDPRAAAATPGLSPSVNRAPQGPA